MDHRPTPHWSQAHPAPRLEPPQPAPGALVQPRYQWRYLYAFVHPGSGRTWWLLLPTVSIATFVIVLTKFAQAIGAGRSKQILLMLDSAG